MFRMTVADVFFIRGRGVVVTGGVDEGSVRVGDDVRINDAQPIRVDGIETSGSTVEEAQAPADIGLLFTAIEQGSVKRGDVISGA